MQGSGVRGRGSGKFRNQKAVGRTDSGEKKSQEAEDKAHRNEVGNSKFEIRPESKRLTGLFQNSGRICARAKSQGEE
jgi:hypothetical protein